MKLTESYAEALVFAFELHKAQFRKGSEIPYVAHLLGVSSLVLENGGNEAEAIAGLLHDAAEDQGGEPVLAEIERRFGRKVSEIVLGCTDSLEEPKPPWKQRKERYLEHVPTANASIQLVSSCDKLYNARSIVADYRALGETLWGRFRGGREGTLWYYRALADAFSIENPAVHELRRVVAELERLTGHPR